MNIKYFNGLIVLLAIVVFSACDKNSTENTDKSTTKKFQAAITIENSKTQYSIGDTIWFSSTLSDKLFDYQTEEDITLENQTFVLNGLVNLLKPVFDSIPFLYHNFDLIADIGEIQLINVVNSATDAFSFDIKFGRPLLTNKIRFGMVLNYAAVFGFECNAWVFYGSERLDFDDFSIENERGIIGLSFSAEDLNDSVFYALPIDYLNYYENYYNTGDIASGKFYFFDVEVSK